MTGPNPNSRLQALSAHIIESGYCSDEIDTSDEEEDDDDDMIYPSEHSNFIGDIYEVEDIILPPTPPTVAAAQVDTATPVTPLVAQLPTRKAPRDPPAAAIKKDQLDLLVASMEEIPDEIMLEQHEPPAPISVVTEHLLEQQPEEEEEPCVTVGLSQVTFFPSHTLKVEETDKCCMFDSECLWFSLFGMCLDEEQMISSAAAIDSRKNNQKSYVPPPVTWSQPVIIVPPQESEDDEDDGKSSEKGGKKVKFQDGGSKPPSRMVLLHGRVARALGIHNGDLVVAQFQGQTKRQFYKASVDDRASFNVVIEAKWKDVVDSYYPNPKARKLHSDLNRNNRAPLRYVDLKVERDTDDESGDSNQNARFHLTPSDGLRHGVLYFDGSVGVNPTQGGLVAGTGFCIYSCQYREGDEEEDSRSDDDYYDSDESTNGGSLPIRLKVPSKCTELVSSFRYLGRPFCPKHAEYSALIEGLEWLFRFRFDRVTIVGATEVLTALTCEHDGNQKTENTHDDYQPFDELLAEKDEEEDDECRALEIPQLRRANSIAQGMIDKALDGGLEVDFKKVFGDERWEATELAEKALREENNECQVLWDNIQEARYMDLKDQPNFEVRSSLRNSVDTEVRRQSTIVRSEVEGCLREAASSDSWSLLKGEDVLVEEFQPAAISPRDQRARCDSCSTEPTKQSFKDERMATKEAHKKHNDNQEVILSKEEYEKLNGNQEGGQDAKEAEGGEQLVLNDLKDLKFGRGSTRWLNFAKALRNRRATNKYASINSQSDTVSLGQHSAEDDRSICRSTWMATTNTPTVESPTRYKIRVEDNRGVDSEEKVNDDDFLDAKVVEVEPTSLSDDSDLSEESPPAYSSGSLCFLLDLDFLQGAQVVADDVKQLFVAEDVPATTPTNKSSTTSQQQDPEDDHAPSEYESLGHFLQDHKPLYKKRYAYV